MRPVLGQAPAEDGSSHGDAPYPSSECKAENCCFTSAPNLMPCLVTNVKLEPARGGHPGDR